MKERESAKLALDAQTQLTQLNNQQKDLNEKIAYLKTPEGTETELRGIYNAAKPGESVVLIIDPKNPTSTPVQQKSWWQKFLGFFTNQN
jgi:histidinol-phosphate/aromatic aminotransferase/cobyric acid decarboxylase-like protein